MDDQQLQAQVSQRSTKVQQLINQHKAADAMLLALDDPPIYTKDDRIKASNAQTVLSAINACNKTEMKSVMSSLTPPLQDTLMKYLYRGLALPQNNASLLEWHAQLVAKAGTGCIVRALTDRKTV